jgi:hypothetical protein
MLEGNGFSGTGIFVQTLEAGTSFPTGAGSTIFTANQPDVQSIGTYDPDANEILYYHNQFIHRYNRANNAFITQFRVNNLPVPFSSINSNTLLYTGCPGQELGLFDHVNRRVYFINKANGNVNGSSQLPNTAPTRSSFGVSYANQLFWIYNNSTSSWLSFRVLNYDNILSASSEKKKATFSIYPNPATEALHINVFAPNGTGKVEIMNMQGKLVIAHALAPGGNTLIDTGELPAGMYLARVQQGSSISVQKFMKE